MGERPSLSLRKRSGLRGQLGAEEAEVGAGCLGGGRVGTAPPHHRPQHIADEKIGSSPTATQREIRGLGLCAQAGPCAGFMPGCGAARDPAGREGPVGQAEGEGQEKQRCLGRR